MSLETYTSSSLDDRDVVEKMQDVLHNYRVEQGIKKSLFLFLQAWLYVKEHQNVMWSFRLVDSFIKEHENT